MMIGPVDVQIKGLTESLKTRGSRGLLLFAVIKLRPIALDSNGMKFRQ